MTHTPTPWHVSAHWDSYYSPYYLLHGDVPADNEQTATSIRDQHEANAAFIVRCCNSHDELVKALEELLEDCDGWSNPETGAYRLFHPTMASLNKARKALAAAKGEA